MIQKLLLQAVGLFTIMTALAGCNNRQLMPVHDGNNAPSGYKTEVSLASFKTTQAVEWSATPDPQTTSQQAALTYSPSPASQIIKSAPATATETVELLCNLAAPGNPIDIEITDNTRMLPGEKFTKVWRLVNAGACTWDHGYQAVWFFGETFGETARVSLGESVRPGESIDIVVDMIAPERSGIYQGNWKLQSTRGEVFGIGPNGKSPFWVRIIVAKPATATQLATPQPGKAPVPTRTPSVTPTSTPIPQVLVSSQLSLAFENQIDLDAGLYTGQISTGSMHFIAVNHVDFSSKLEILTWKNP